MKGNRKKKKHRKQLTLTEKGATGGKPASLGGIGEGTEGVNKKDRQRERELK